MIANYNKIIKQNIDIKKALVLFYRCLKSISGRASDMAIFIGMKNNIRGQVSVCGDAYRGSVVLLRQHLALFVYVALSFNIYKDFADRGI